MDFHDRVSWEYKHSLNAKSSTMIVKHGEFLGLIQHAVRYGGPQLAAVRFDGNKTVSKVPLTELHLL